jgi:hypothetical protein
VAGDVYLQDFGKVANGIFQVVQRWDLAQPKLTVDVSGAGSSFHLPTPKEAADRSPFVGTAKLPLVNGGDGTAAELAGAKDAVALIRWRATNQVTKQVKAAKDAGAKAVFMYNEQPGYWSTGSNQGIPFYLLEAEPGKQLVDLLAKGPVTVQLNGVLDSTYRYDLALGPSVVKGPLTYDIARMRPAVVTTDFPRNDAWWQHTEQRTAHLPGISAGLLSSRQINGPLIRTDYLASDVEGVTWDEKTAAGEWQESGFEYTIARGYRPNEKVTQTWWDPLMRPATPDNVSGSESQGLPAARFENALRIAIPQYVSGDGDIYGWGDRGDVTSLKLSSNGVELGSKNWSVAQFAVPAKTAWYDLVLDQKRGPNSWATTSTATHTEWRFLSKPARERSVLPLVQVDYKTANGRLELKPGYQPGVRGLGLFRTTAEISYDGTTWQRLSLSPRGFDGTVGARIPVAPADASYANIRVTATDLVGNKISQTIEKAWVVER